MSGGGSTKGGTGAYGANPMTNAANGFTDAFNLLRGAGGAMSPAFQGYNYSPQQAATWQAPANVSGQTYNYSPQQAQGYNAHTMSNPSNVAANTYAAPQLGAASTYSPQAQEAAAYQAAMQQGPQSIASLLDRYQNPYENQVVQNTTRQMQDALRQAQMGNSDAAIASGAFGGGRHGVVEGVTNAQAIKGIGDVTGQLRQQGFNTAAGLAGQDIANTLGVNSANQAAQNAARSQNADALNNMRQFNANQAAEAGQFNAGAQNQFAQLNAAMRENAGQFNSSAQNNMSQFNQSNLLDIMRNNQAALNAQRQYGADATNAMRQFNAQQQTQQGQFNANSANQANQFNAGMQADAGRYNADALNAMRQFNAQQQTQAGQFNAMNRYGAQQDYINNLMGLSSSLGNLAQASYGVGNSINQQQMQQGAMSQQLMQQILGAAQGGYDQQTQQAAQLLQMRLAALGMNPLNNATTTNQTVTTNPGWGAMFGNVLGAAGNMFSFNPITLPWGKR